MNYHVCCCLCFRDMHVHNIRITVNHKFNALTDLKDVHYLMIVLCSSEYENHNSYLSTGKGGWSAWSPGQCSHTCGGGIRVITRNCTTPSNPQCCPGNATMIEKCGDGNCGETVSLYKMRLHFVVQTLAPHCMHCLLHSCRCTDTWWLVTLD